jgi:hypothetical protein
VITVIVAQTVVDQISGRLRRVRRHVQRKFQLTDPLHLYIHEWRDLKVGEPQHDGSIRTVDPVRPVSIRDPPPT